MKETYYIDITGVWRIEEYHDTIQKPKQFTYEMNCYIKGLILKNLVNYEKEIFDFALTEMNKL